VREQDSKGNRKRGVGVGGEGLFGREDGGNGEKARSKSKKGHQVLDS